VWKAFDDPENMKIWQPSLVRTERLGGTTGQPGSVSKLTYKQNEREFSLISGRIFHPVLCRHAQIKDVSHVVCNMRQLNKEKLLFLRHFQKLGVLKCDLEKPNCIIAHNRTDQRAEVGPCNQ
jgi:hypothetical protein